MTDFGTLKIDEVIMHRVPKGVRYEGGPEQIEFSEAPIELSELDKGFIQLRLRDTLAGRARPVVEDPSFGSEAPGILRDLVAGTVDLVEASVALAVGLHQRQKWVSPVGLVMVISSVLDGERCIIVAKMEHEEGMRVQRTETIDGKRTYRAEYLHDLILGQGTRVFKVGVFKESGAHAGSPLSGLVVDAQQAGSAVAAYFVEFLGCAFTQRPEVLTETFFKESQRFISRVSRGDPERAAEYEIALLSELQSHSSEIRPEVFARSALRAEDRDQYIAQMSSCGLPSQAFTKDNSLIVSSIRRLKVQTSRGATIYAPPEMYEDGSLSVEEGDGETSIVTVIDRIKGISGASGPR